MGGWDLIVETSWYPCPIRWTNDTHDPNAGALVKDCLVFTASDWVPFEFDSGVIRRSQFGFCLVVSHAR